MATFRDLEQISMEDLWTEDMYTKKYEAQKPSIHAIRSRARLFEDSDDEDVPSNGKDKPKPRMVRGRPLRAGKDVRPGDAHLSEITRQIRQLSHTSFTNESIEDSNNRGLYPLKFEDADMPDLSFRTVRTSKKEPKRSRSSSSEEDSSDSTVKNDSDSSSYYSAE